MTNATLAPIDPENISLREVPLAIWSKHAFLSEIREALHQLDGAIRIFNLQDHYARRGILTDELARRRSASRAAAQGRKILREQAMRVETAAYLTMARDGAVLS